MSLGFEEDERESGKEEEGGGEGGSGRYRRVAAKRSPGASNVTAGKP